MALVHAKILIGRIWASEALGKHAWESSGCEMLMYGNHDVAAGNENRIVCGIGPQ